jgi:hypothetical protein
MINIKTFESFVQNTNIKTLYRGTDHPKDFTENRMVWAATDLSVAKGYGDNVYELEVDLGRVFDSLSVKDLTILLDEGFELIDTYDDTEYTHENIADLAHGSDTWETIENSYGVMDYLEGNYDSIRIVEGGSEVNYILFNPKTFIKNYKEL